MFFYLKEKYGVKFIINDAFNIKNNIESLYLARSELKNTYVCVSDSYFVENPFSRFEYQTFYAGLSVSEVVNELYVDTDSDGRIIRMAENRDAGRSRCARLGRSRGACCWGIPSGEKNSPTPLSPLPKPTGRSAAITPASGSGW